MLNWANAKGAAVLLLSTLGACGPYVAGHSVATSSAADGRYSYTDPSAVQISALSIPAGALELGIVQAHTVGGSIEDAMPEFRNQVARLGGDFGKVNEIGTKFELQTQTYNESYNCGSANHPMTCTRASTRTVEVATTSILGKAYRLGAAPAAPPAPPAPAAPPVAPPADEVAPAAAPAAPAAPEAPPPASPPPAPAPPPAASASPESP